MSQPSSTLSGATGDQKTPTLVSTKAGSRRLYVTTKKSDSSKKTISTRPSAVSTIEEQIESDVRKINATLSQTKVKRGGSAPAGPPSNIKEISASIFRKADVLRSCPRITRAETSFVYGDGAALIGTLFSTQLGPSNYCSKCSTCIEQPCPGHCGVIDLGQPGDQENSLEPYIHPKYGGVVKAIYNIICDNTKCRKLLMTEQWLRRNNYFSYPFDSRVKEIERYFNDTLWKKTPPSQLICPHCKTVKEYAGRANLDKTSNRLTISGKVLSNYTLYAFLHGIKSATARLMGIAPLRRGLQSNFTSTERGERGEEEELSFMPHDLLNSYLIVLPPLMWESTSRDGSVKKSHLQLEYEQVIAHVLSTMQIKEGQQRLKDTRETIHARIFSIYSANKGQSTRRAGSQESRGIQEEITGKEGLVRENLMGKRVDFSARAVVTGDPNMSFGDIGIPQVMAEGQIDVHYVTEHTLPRIQELYDAGELIYYIPASTKYNRNMKTIKELKQKPELKVGDKVTTTMRELREVLFGRNPSIHKVSIMCAKAKIVPGYSIRMHNSYTSPLNMDYDGDEIHLKFPQGLMARSECRYLASVEHNIINTENSAASMGAVMDAITTFYMATASRDVGHATIPQKLYNEMRALLPPNYDGLYKLEERLAYHNIDKLSARGTLSMLFPPNFYYKSEGRDKSEVLIRDGILLSGTIGKPQIGAAKNSIAQAIYQGWRARFSGEKRAAQFIDATMRLTDYYLTQYRGQSIGLGDVHIWDPYVEKIKNNAVRSIRAAAATIDRNTIDPFKKQGVENEMANLFQNKSTQIGQKTTKEVLTGDEGFRPMITSGAKGDIFHASQMVVMGGQQFENGGRPILEMSEGTRLTPYFPPGSKDIRSKGFIENSLGKGFDPIDEVSHHIATRGALLDTTTKTVDAGDYHHLQNKAFLDHMVEYDATNRDANGMIVQFLAGGTGIDPYEMVWSSYEGLSFPFFINVPGVVEECNSIVFWGQPN